MKIRRRELGAALLGCIGTRLDGASQLRYAICNETFQGASFTECCRLARETGYSGIEIMPGTLASDPARLTASDRRAIRETMRSEGLGYVGIHAFMTAPAGMHLTGPDAGTRKRSWEFFRRMIDLCSDLGEGSLMIFGSSKQRAAVGGVSVEQAIGRLKEGLANEAGHARDRGVTILLEPLAPHLCNVVNTVGEAAAIAAEIGSPAVATMFDTHNAIAETLPHDQVIRKYSGAIRHVHLNELDGRHPGTGQYDFARVLRALEVLGYEGWVSLEVFSLEPGGREIASSTRGFLKGLGF